MLETLRGRASDRKLRLFAVGCCHRTLTGTTPARSLLAVQVAERFADGLAGRQELLRARSLPFHAAEQFSFRRSEELREKGEAWLPRNLSDEEVRLYFVAETAHPYTPVRIGLLRHRLRWDYQLMRVAPAMLRDVVGNPFRPATFGPCWRTPNVVVLARRIYDEGTFDRMPELADALEGAGCDDADTLGHCRGAGPHARGCWVIDALLGMS
jgi:hypothetical protein